MSCVPCPDISPPHIHDSARAPCSMPHAHGNIHAQCPMPHSHSGAYVSCPMPMTVPMPRVPCPIPILEPTSHARCPQWCHGGHTCRSCDAEHRGCVGMESPQDTLPAVCCMPTHPPVALFLLAISLGLCRGLMRSSHCSRFSPCLQQIWLRRGC